MEFEAFMDKFEGFIGTNFWTMIFAWINLLILFLVLKKKVFGPVKKMIDDRQKDVDNMYADAEKAKTDSEAMKADYEERLSNAKEEADDIVRKAIRKGQLKEEEILKDAEDKAKERLARAENQIEMEKKQAINDIKDEVGNMAIDIASAVIERDVSKEEHQALIDDFIGKIGDK